MSINAVLAPFAVILHSTELAEETDKLTQEEQLFLTRVTSGVDLKNIDIYVHVETKEEVYALAEQVQKEIAAIEGLRTVSLVVRPNGIAALKVEAAGGYPHHEFELVLKPKLKIDLREQLSPRQKASEGLLERDGEEWLVSISDDNITRLSRSDSFVFLASIDHFPHQMLQLGRSLRFNAVLNQFGDNKVSDSDLFTITQSLDTTYTPFSETQLREVDRYMLLQSANEFLVAFLHNPTVVLDVLLSAPVVLFPFIDRQAVEKNRHEIVKQLSKRPGSLFTTPESQQVNLSEIAALLTGSRNKLHTDSAITGKYQSLLESIDEKVGLSEMLTQEDSLTSWSFENYTDYFLLLLAFQAYPAVWTYTSISKYISKIDCHINL